MNEGVDIRQEAIRLWKKHTGKVEKLFGLQVRSVPESVRILDSPKDRLFESVLDNNILFLPSLVVQYPTLLEGVIARTCLMQAVPSNLLCPECIADFATEYGRQHVGNKQDHGIWIEEWNRLSTPQQIDSVRVYNPYRTFSALYALNGQEPMVTLLKELIEFSKGGLVLTFPQYVEYLHTRPRRITAKLGRLDLKLIKYLTTRHQTVETLSQCLGKSREWISKSIANLVQRRVLRRYDIVHFSRIGIRMFYLLIGKTDVDEDPLDLVKNCPFVYSVQRVISGPWEIICLLSVPDNIDSIKSVMTFQKILLKRKYDVKITEIVSSGRNHCFDYYYVDSSTWNIPWELMEVNLHRIHNSNLADVIPNICTIRAPTHLSLDKTDIEILDLVRKGINSISKIRQTLRIGQANAHARLKRLRDDGIVETLWEVHNVGLTESAVVISFEEHVGKSIAAWSQRLPKAFISFNVDQDMFLRVFLPQGGSYSLAHCLNRSIGDIDVCLTGEPIYGKWGFPVHMWNPDNNRWLAPLDDISSWFESIQ